MGKGSLSLPRAALRTRSPRPKAETNLAETEKLRREAAAIRKVVPTAHEAGAAAAAYAGYDDFSVLMQLGREAHRAGRRSEANLCFSRAAAAEPESEEAWLWTAATSDDSELALACLEKALAINPASGRARTQVAGIGEPGPSVKRELNEPVGVGAGAEELLQQGVTALDGGNDDRAYQFFTSATREDPRNEAAWFWRAKTAVDLVEVISCLERVLAINPRNEKARASLDWAQERQQMDRARHKFVASLPSTPVIPQVFVEPDPPREPFLRLASFAYFIVGVLWIAPVVLPLIDESLASIYRKASFLPVLKIPHLSPSALGLSELSLPEMNLFLLVPALIGIVSFVAMDTSWNRRLAASAYVALAATTSIVATGLFVVGQSPSIIMIGLSALAGLASISGHIAHQRRLRKRAKRARGSARLPEGAIWQTGV